MSVNDENVQSHTSRTGLSEKSQNESNCSEQMFALFKTKTAVAPMSHRCMFLVASKAGPGRLRGQLFDIQKTADAFDKNVNFEGLLKELISS